MHTFDTLRSTGCFTVFFVNLQNVNNNACFRNPVPYVKDSLKQRRHLFNHLRNLICNFLFPLNTDIKIFYF